MTAISRAALPLHFIVYTPFSHGGQTPKPGALQHNCIVAAQRFLPLLKRIGDVSDVAATTDITALVQAAIQNGRQPLLICFAPPHLLPAQQPCPVLAFFAWAYDTIPTEAWCDDMRNDWRNQLRACAGVVTHSRHALQAINAVTRNTVATTSIAVPVPNSFFDLFDPQYTPASAGEWELQFNGVILDSRALGLDRDINGSDIIYEPTSCRGVFVGIVYCLVVDPIDKSKNWLDSLWAFGYAFRDNPNVTLIIKLCHYNSVRVCALLHYEMRKLAPFRCRVVAVAAWLDDTQFDQLIKGSTYIVNSANAEAQGLTLLEFMAAGKPAVTPNHTALGEYISADAAFIFNSSREWTHWPHDPRMMLRTHSYRIDWSGYRDALLRSYAVATGDIPHYQTMSRRAHDAAFGHCAPEQIEQRLLNYLTIIQTGLPPPRSENVESNFVSGLRFLKRSIKHWLARL